jgi:hypothetical protein
MTTFFFFIIFFIYYIEPCSAQKNDRFTIDRKEFEKLLPLFNDVIDTPYSTIKAFQHPFEQFKEVIRDTLTTGRWEGGFSGIEDMGGTLTIDITETTPIIKGTVEVESHGLESNWKFYGTVRGKIYKNRILLITKDRGYKDQYSFFETAIYKVVPNQEGSKVEYVLLGIGEENKKKPGKEFFILYKKP